MSLARRRSYAAAALAGLFATQGCDCDRDPGSDASTIGVPNFGARVFGLQESRHLFADGTPDDYSWLYFAFLGDYFARDGDVTASYAYDPVTGDGCVSSWEGGGGGNRDLLNVGALAITGGLVDVAMDTTGAPSFADACAPPSIPVPFIFACLYSGRFFETGQLITASAPGGAELGAFVLQDEAPDDLELLDPAGAPVVIVPGEPLILRWVPGNVAHVIFDVETDSAAPGPSFYCRSDDDGTIVIPGEETAKIVLRDLADGEYPQSLLVTRIRTSEALSSDDVPLRLVLSTLTRLPIQEL